MTKLESIFFSLFFLLNTSPRKCAAAGEIIDWSMSSSSFSVTPRSPSKGHPSLRRAGPQPRNNHCNPFVWTAQKAKEGLGKLKVLSRYFHQKKPRTERTTDITFATKAPLPHGSLLAFLSCTW